MHIAREEIESYFWGDLPEGKIPDVESHVEACEVCRAVYNDVEKDSDPVQVFFESLFASTPDDRSRKTLPAKFRDQRQLPFTLGEYECRKEIGGGGFGIVYRAWDAKLNRDVAVKVIRREHAASQELRERFRRDAKSLARCHHANIVWVIRLDQQEEDLYFAMEYVEGGSLEDQLDNRKKLPPREAAQLLKTLAIAVDFAHRQGLIHRDLKPANILFAEHGLETPKITDFGLARWLDRDGLQTEEGTLLGTLCYMSPEQASGKKDVGFPSDIYSLGAILYRCLVGEPPILGESKDEILQRLKSSQPVSAAKLRASVHRDLTFVCMKCLEKRPERRYLTGAELSADLGRFLDGIPIVPLSWPERCMRACRHNPWATAILGAAIVLVLAALLIVSHLTISRGVALAVAERATEQSRRDSHESKAARDQAERERDKLRRAAYALQVSKAASVVDGDPQLAKRMLDDKQFCPTDLQDLSRRYLRSIASQELEVWEHETEPICMACWRENRRFATGDQEGKVRLWQFRTDVTAPSDWRGEFNGAVTGLAVSADSCWLGASSKDGTVRIWDVSKLQTPKPLLVIDPKAGPINGLALSPKKDYLATAHRDKNVRIWRVPTKLATDSPQTLSEPAEVLLGAKESVAQVAFTSDGRFLVSGCDDGRVRVWKTEDWKEFAALSGHGAAVKSVATHPDPKMSDVFATGGSDRTVLVWRIAGKGVSAPTERLQFDERVTSLAFDGDNLAAASQDGSLQLCNFNHVYSTPRRISLESEVLSVAFGCGGELLVGTKDGTVRRWRNGAGDNPLVFPTHSQGTRGVNGIVFSADGRTLATGGQDGEVRLWSTADGKSRGKLGSFKQPVAGFAFCKDRSRLVWSAEGKTFVASEWTAATVPAELDLGWQVPSALGVSGAGDRLFIGNAWGGMNAWAIPLGGAEVWKPELDTPILYLAVATDGTQAVAASGSCLWWFDFATKVKREIELEPAVSSSEVSCVAISPDGHLVALGTKNGTVYVHEASEGGHLATASGHSRRVRWLAFSPDNRTLASGSEDGFVRLWDPEMGYERLALRAGTPVDIVDFSPDGSQFAAGCRDGTVHIWRCSSE